MFTSFFLSLSLPLFLSQCYQSTSLAPLIHLSDIASEVLSCHVSMINIVTDDDTGASTTLIEVDKDDFEHGNEREKGREGRIEVRLKRENERI